MSYDLNNWEAVKVESTPESTGWEVKVQTGKKKWLTVCDTYCIELQRKSFSAQEMAERIAKLPQYEDALKTLWAFYNDLAASNPGFMGKMALQDYEQWNQALLKTERLLGRVR